MIGINEIKAQNRIIDNYDKIIKKIQEISPYTIIYVQSILPTRTKTIDNADIVATNARLRELCASQNQFVHYLDIYAPFPGRRRQARPQFHRRRHPSHAKRLFVVEKAHPEPNVTAPGHPPRDQKRPLRLIRTLAIGFSCHGSRCHRIAIIYPCR